MWFELLVGPFLQVAVGAVCGVSAPLNSFIVQRSARRGLYRTSLVFIIINGLTHVDERAQRSFVTHDGKTKKTKKTKIYNVEV